MCGGVYKYFKGKKSPTINYGWENSYHEYYLNAKNESIGIASFYVWIMQSGTTEVVLTFKH